MLRVAFVILISSAVCFRRKYDEIIILDVAHSKWMNHSNILKNYIDHVYVIPEEPFYITLINCLVKNATCENYYTFSEPFYINIETIGNDTVIGVPDVNDDMNTVWKCTIIEQNVTRMIFFEVQFQSANSPQRILVNTTTMPTERARLTDEDIDIIYKFVYNYKESDSVHVFCLYSGNSQCTVSIDYNSTNNLYDRRRTQTSTTNHGVNYLIELYPRNNNSQIICSYLCPKKPSIRVVVTFILNKLEEKRNDSYIEVHIKPRKISLLKFSIKYKQDPDVFIRISFTDLTTSSTIERSNATEAPGKMHSMLMDSIIKSNRSANVLVNTDTTSIMSTTSTTLIKTPTTTLKTILTSLHNTAVTLLNTTRVTKPPLTQSTLRNPVALTNSLRTLLYTTTLIDTPSTPLNTMTLTNIPTTSLYKMITNTSSAFLYTTTVNNSPIVPLKIALTKAPTTALYTTFTNTPSSLLNATSLAMTIQNLYINLSKSLRLTSPAVFAICFAHAVYIINSQQILTNKRVKHLFSDEVDASDNQSKDPPDYLDYKESISLYDIKTTIPTYDENTLKEQFLDIPSTMNSENDHELILMVLIISFLCCALFTFTVVMWVLLKRSPRIQNNIRITNITTQRQRLQDAQPPASPPWVYNQAADLEALYAKPLPKFLRPKKKVKIIYSNQNAPDCVIYSNKKISSGKDNILENTELKNLMMMNENSADKRVNQKNVENHGATGCISNGALDRNRINEPR